jgi:hypothetical protein
MALKPASTFTALSTPIADPKTGLASWAWLKKFQEWEQKLQNGLSLIGQFIGNIDPTATIGMRAEGIGTTVQNLDSAGVVTGNGVDFQRAYLNKSTDHIADGAGSPLLGGATAYQALVASAPSTGNALVFSTPSGWNPGTYSYSNLTGAPALAATTPPVSHEWIAGYDAASGAFTQSQPAFSDVSGVATAAQVPALSGLTGAVTASQLPAGVPVVSFGVGVPVAASTEGYLYFDTTAAPYHGYVFHSGAWVQFS